MLCESFIQDLIIFLPYYPVATMERVLNEGEVATANTVSRMLSHLPNFGRPVASRVTRRSSVVDGGGGLGAGVGRVVLVSGCRVGSDRRGLGRAAAGRRPARVMLYDLHTLQNRFYFHSNALASASLSRSLSLRRRAVQTRWSFPSHPLLHA